MMETQGKGPQLQEEEKMEKEKGVKAKMERTRIKRKENRKAEEREARVEIAVAAILQVAPRNHHAKEKEKERIHHEAEKAQERAPQGVNPPTRERSRNKRQADHLQEYATPNFAHSTDKANATKTNVISGMHQYAGISKKSIAKTNASVRSVI